MWTCISIREFIGSISDELYAKQKFAHARAFTLATGIVWECNQVNIIPDGIQCFEVDVNPAALANVLELKRVESLEYIQLFQSAPQGLEGSILFCVDRTEKLGLISFLLSEVNLDEHLHGTVPSDPASSFPHTTRTSKRKSQTVNLKA